MSLAAFVSRAMAITATTPGMGGAASGVLGTAGVGDPAVIQLKKSVVAFAEAYRANPHGKTVPMLAKEVEGALATLQAMSVISGEQGDQLTAELYDLVTV